jgi:opacity protein-like surface antigen
MNRNIVAAAALALGLSVSASVSQAQRSTRRFPAVQSIPSPSITPYGGYMVFGDILNGPLGTSLHSSASPVYGAQVNLPLGSELSIVGNLGYSQPNLEVGIPILGGVDVGQSNVWMYDAGLQLAAPIMTAQRAITPFVQAGVGGMHYNVQVEGVDRTASNLAFNAGVGADLPIAQNLGLRIMAKDYIGKFDFNDATSLDYSSKNTNNIALSAGLKLDF